MDIPPGQHVLKHFIYYSALKPPKVDIDNYLFEVSVNVENPRSFTYNELISMIDFKGKMNFHCVTGWSVLDVQMEGITFKKISDIVKPQGKYAYFISLDGYTTVVPYEDFLKGILLLRINGRPLSYEEGFPARPFFEHLYAWKSAKWVTKLQFLNEYIDGYWEMYGYHERGNVWLEERFKSEEAKRLRKSPMQSVF
ncbi:MAG: molybdopterin-dependent oxidoreductase [Thaumarchaeota archaeon]|jgi:DMSO/TMAO reductase YedYZ molybdopterin-dependent catalytic subunit|nr:molybdopterin-dependent oxidoreductase [Nitrososphaerota archaeon]